VSGTDYLLAGWGSNASNSMVADAFVGFDRFTNTGQTFGIWPATIGKNNTVTDEAYSIYATFTVSGGAPPFRFRRRRIINTLGGQE